MYFDVDQAWPMVLNLPQKYLNDRDDDLLLDAGHYGEWMQVVCQTGPKRFFQTGPDSPTIYHIWYIYIYMYSVISYFCLYHLSHEHYELQPPDQTLPRHHRGTIVQPRKLFLWHCGTWPQKNSDPSPHGVQAALAGTHGDNYWIAA